MPHSKEFPLGKNREEKNIDIPPYINHKEIPIEKVKELDGKGKTHDNTKDVKDVKDEDGVVQVSSVSEYVTKELLNRYRTVKNKLKIIVLDKKTKGKGLVRLVTDDKHRKNMIIYHNSLSHLPLHQSAIEEWCNEKGIKHAGNINELDRMVKET